MIYKQNSLGLIVIPAIVILGIVYFFFNPAESQLFPKCPFLFFTGYQCPGCGSQRALHALLHLRFNEAISHNALFVASVPYILTGFVLSFEKVKIRFPKMRRILFGKTALFVVATLIVMLFIFRNFQNLIFAPHQ